MEVKFGGTAWNQEGPPAGDDRRVNHLVRDAFHPGDARNEWNALDHACE